ncbi:hypothetical protein CAEBREN_16675 [Caenorhabditis brenneri]|uniref:Uncharacterized protein n=1 Tax=Caenorhabditis brenneri TaxID=135651 RepID=G0NV45_CAEBE|nr:hypothetical protein CAEBREN_16675 [Caenorhabditis brenneri]
MIADEPIEAGEPNGAVAEIFGVDVEAREKGLVEDVESNLVPNRTAEAGEPNGAAAEALEVEDEAQEAKANASGIDGTGDKKNQPVSNPVEQADSVKPISKSLVGTRSLSSTNLVRDAAPASMPSEKSRFGNTNDVSAAPPSGESSPCCKTNSIIIAGTSENADTSVTTSSKDSISASWNAIAEEHSYATSTAQGYTDNVVLADTIPVLISSTDLAVDHEEKVKTTTFEIPAQSSSKRRGKKRSSKKKNQVEASAASPKRAKTARIVIKASDRDEDGYPGPTKIFNL